MGWSIRGHICVRRQAKDGTPGAAGKSIRTTVWSAGKQYYAGDTQVDGVYPLDIVSDKAMSVGVSGVNFYMCKVSHTSSANIPLTNTNYWTKLNSLKPVVTYLILSELIKAEYIDVDTLSVKHLNSADGVFSGIVQFPMVDFYNYTDYVSGDIETGPYVCQLRSAGPVSLIVPINMRYQHHMVITGRTPLVNVLQLPSDVPDGVIVNILSPTNYRDETLNNGVGLFQVVTATGYNEIFYNSSTPANHVISSDDDIIGNPMKSCAELEFYGLFYLRLVSYEGRWYVISVQGDCVAKYNDNLAVPE